ncbi:endospore germination permease [Paenibacillus sp. HJL G12]|uniref:Endospore germination permease n=1 Tax=Paenibacillus dendrobii TaxID=2691084 RepID=A0A7X3LIY3_9BACL|nr:endospore germination permease [Paenibacillus dendrobii]MWV45695.1 endospore germination permease [Paenibacillus dendrobii]
MIEKGKISGMQMGFMMYPTVVSTAILMVPSVTEKYAHNDLWISTLLASLVGFISMYIAYQLHRLYPNQTVIQYSVHIIPRLAGKVLGLLFLFFYLHSTGAVVREYADFISDAFLPQTPMIFIASSLLLLSAFSVRYGVESVARSAFIFTIIFAFPVIFLLLLIPDLTPGNILPVMEHGILPSLRGAIVPQSWFSEFFMISFFLPFLSDIRKGRKWGLISVFAAMISLTTINLTILLLFGDRVSGMSYPVLNAFRYIRMGVFFENFEAIIMAIWILGNFVKVSVFYYSASLGLAQWLNLKDIKPVVLPLGILIIIFAYWSLPSFQDVTYYLTGTFAYYGPLMQTIIPACLLSIAFVRRKRPSSS